MAIAERVRANARARRAPRGVTDCHGTAELAFAAAVLIGSGHPDPRDRVVREEAEAIAGLMASAGRRTFSGDLPEPPAELVELWDGIRDRLRARFPTSTFELWIEPIRPVALRERRLLVAAPTSVAAWIERRYAPTLRELADVDEIVVAAYEDDDQ